MDCDLQSVALDRIATTDRTFLITTSVDKPDLTPAIRSAVRDGFVTPVSGLGAASRSRLGPPPLFSAGYTLEHHPLTPFPDLPGFRFRHP